MRTRKSPSLRPPLRSSRSTTNTCWDLQSLTSCPTSSQNMTETIRAAALLCCPVLVAECFYVSLWHLVLTKERWWLQLFITVPQTSTLVSLGLTNLLPLFVQSPLTGAGWGASIALRGVKEGVDTGDRTGYLVCNQPAPLGWCARVRFLLRLTV